MRVRNRDREPVDIGGGRLLDPGAEAEVSDDEHVRGLIGGGALAELPQRQQASTRRSSSGGGQKQKQRTSNSGGGEASSGDAAQQQAHDEEGSQQ